MGTAPTMQIEENLALAARRGQSRSLRPGITRTEREQYRELLKILDLGLEDRLTSKVGLLSGGQRQALTLQMCIRDSAEEAPAPAAGRAYRRPGPQNGGQGSGHHGEDRAAG